MTRLRILFLLFMGILFLTSCGDDEEINSEDNSACITATENATTASNNLDFATSNNYTSLCNNYKAALEEQISECGDDDGNIQNIINDLGDCSTSNESGNGKSVGCAGMQMTGFFGNVTDCSYDVHQNRTIANVYIEERYLDDNHFLTSLYVTDGTVTLNANNEFVSISDRSYVIEFQLYAFESDGFQAGIYNFFDINTYLSTSYLSGTASFDNCNDNDRFHCQDEYIFLNGVVEISENSDHYELCFDTLIDLEENCFNGTYSGEFIPIVIP